jgi:hypothetical protein
MNVHLCVCVNLYGIQLLVLFCQWLGLGNPYFQRSNRPKVMRFSSPCLPETRGLSWSIQIDAGGPCASQVGFNKIIGYTMVYPCRMRKNPTSNGWLLVGHLLCQLEAIAKLRADFSHRRASKLGALAIYSTQRVADWASEIYTGSASSGKAAVKVSN